MTTPINWPSRAGRCRGNLIGMDTAVACAIRMLKSGRTEAAMWMLTREHTTVSEFLHELDVEDTAIFANYSAEQVLA